MNSNISRISNPLIKPPIYKQTWFIALIIVIVLIASYYWYCTCYVGSKCARPRRSKMTNPDKKDAENKTKKKKADDDEESEEAETFVASGGRDDSQGIDWALKDQIHAINEQQRQYVQNAKYSYRYDEREDSAAPAIYSPEAELQNGLYP